VKSLETRKPCGWDVPLPTTKATPSKRANSSAKSLFDRVGLDVLRDPYTKARNSIVTFHARRRVGGALVDGAAVKGLSV
jgi:hypothetical protein